MDNAVWYVSSWFISFKNELSLLPPLTGYNRQDVAETSSGHSTKVSDMLEPRLTIEIRPHFSHISIQIHPIIMESSGIWPCCKGNLGGPNSPLPLWEEGYIPVDELWEYKTDESGARLGHQLKAERLAKLQALGFLRPYFTTIYNDHLIYCLKRRHEVSL